MDTQDAPPKDCSERPTVSERKIQANRLKRRTINRAEHCLW